MNNLDQHKKILKYVTLVFLLYSIYTIFFWIAKGENTGVVFGYSYGWIVLITILVALSLISLIVIINFKKITIEERIYPKIITNLSWPAVIVICVITVFITHFIQQEKVGDFPSRLWLISGAALICSYLLLVIRKHNVILATTIPLIILSCIYSAIILISPISNYPFSLSWSEGSRFYYSSLFFSKVVYGKEMAWTVLHPARYLLQSVPFGIGINSILFHRLWQSILWLVLLGVTSWAIVRRQLINNRLLSILIAIFIYIFLFNGPVYYYLTLCVIPILLWQKKEKPIRTLLLVVVCSAWAGICRINWYVVPAAFSILIYALEEPLKNKKVDQLFELAGYLGSGRNDNCFCNKSHIYANFQQSGVPFWLSNRIVITLRKVISK